MPSCSEGFVQEASATYTCGADGQWESTDIPECRPVICPSSLPAVENVESSCNLTGYQATCEGKCAAGNEAGREALWRIVLSHPDIVNAGFVVVESTPWVCNGNENWVDGTIGCVEILCPSNPP